MTLTSQQLFSEAQSILPGGVSSPVRAFKQVAATPLFIKRGQGAYVYDINDKKYIDFVGSWGPLILGHTHPEVLSKVVHALHHGFTFGAPTEIEIKFAEKIKDCIPSMEMVRFVSSGTEATMSAIRLARGHTKRDKIIKFAGCYHGHADGLLVAAGSGGLTFGVADSAGVPESVAQQTIVANFNDLPQVTEIFAKFGSEIAAVIIEPIAANMNLVLPLPGFLAGLRALCDQYQSVLIFDEVITGFRVGLGGAQAFYNIVPDITVLGKIIGGGFPAAAFGGKKEIMQSLAPLGPVYQAGTLSGHPIAMTAGLATLEILSSPNFYQELKNKTEQLVLGLNHVAQNSVPFFANTVGAAMFGLHFTESAEIHSETDVKMCHLQNFKNFFHGMLAQGIYLAPSAFEIGFLSSAHGDVEIEQTIAAAKKVFATFSKH